MAQANTGQSSSGQLPREGENTGNPTHQSSQHATDHFVNEPARDIGRLLQDYAHDNPEVAAMWCFGIGLLVGWKLKG